MKNCFLCSLVLRGVRTKGLTIKFKQSREVTIVVESIEWMTSQSKQKLHQWLWKTTKLLNFRNNFAILCCFTAKKFHTILRCRTNRFEGRKHNDAGFILQRFSNDFNLSFSRQSAFSSRHITIFAWRCELTFYILPKPRGLVVLHTGFPSVYILSWRNLTFL